MMKEMQDGVCISIRSKGALIYAAWTSAVLGNSLGDANLVLGESLAWRELLSPTDATPWFYY